MLSESVDHPNYLTKEDVEISRKHLEAYCWKEIFVPSAFNSYKLTDTYGFPEYAYQWGNQIGGKTVAFYFKEIVQDKLSGNIGMIVAYAQKKPDVAEALDEYYLYLDEKSKKLHMGTKDSLWSEKEITCQLPEPDRNDPFDRITHQLESTNKVNHTHQVSCENSAITEALSLDLQNDIVKFRKILRKCGVIPENIHVGFSSIRELDTASRWIAVQNRSWTTKTDDKWDAVNTECKKVWGWRFIKLGRPEQYSISVNIYIATEPDPFDKVSYGITESKIPNLYKTSIVPVSIAVTFRNILRIAGIIKPDEFPKIGGFLNIQKTEWWLNVSGIKWNKDNYDKWEDVEALCIERFKEKYKGLLKPDVSGNPFGAIILFVYTQRPKTISPPEPDPFDKVMYGPSMQTESNKFRKFYIRSS